MIADTITSFSCKRGLPEEKMTIGSIGTRHSLRSACSLPHGSRTPARGGYGNTSTLATFDMFDCLAMPNPYWNESLRGYTGRDKPIADFFALHKDKVNCFLGAAETLVRQSIDEYLKDDRDHLQVAFGCTGGQHRSVYFSERMSERQSRVDGAVVHLAMLCR